MEPFMTSYAVKEFMDMGLINENKIETHYKSMHCQIL
jgi:hypothetical protein